MRRSCGFTLNIVPSSLLIFFTGSSPIFHHNWMHDTRDSTSEKQSERAGLSLLGHTRPVRSSVFCKQQPGDTAASWACSARGPSGGQPFAAFWVKLSSFPFLASPQRTVALAWVLGLPSAYGGSCLGPAPAKAACTSPRCTLDPNILPGSIDPMAAYLCASPLGLQAPGGKAQAPFCGSGPTRHARDVKGLLGVTAEESGQRSRAAWGSLGGNGGPEDSRLCGALAEGQRLLRARQDDNGPTYTPEILPQGSLSSPYTKSCFLLRTIFQLLLNKPEVLNETSFSPSGPPPRNRNRCVLFSFLCQGGI